MAVANSHREGPCSFGAYEQDEQLSSVHEDQVDILDLV